MSPYFDYFDFFLYYLHKTQSSDLAVIVGVMILSLNNFGDLLVYYNVICYLCYLLNIA